MEVGSASLNNLGAEDSDLIVWLRGDQIPPQAVVDCLQVLLGTQAPV